MSVKTDAIALLTAKKDEQLAAVSTLWDGIISQVQSLPEDGDTVALQQQVADLATQLSAVKDALAADDAALADEKNKEVKLQAKLDAIKAALEN